MRYTLCSDHRSVTNAWCTGDGTSLGITVRPTESMYARANLVKAAGLGRMGVESAEVSGGGGRGGGMGCGGKGVGGGRGERRGGQGVGEGRGEKRGRAGHVLSS